MSAPTLPPESGVSLPALPELVSELPILAGDAAHSVMAAVANATAALVALERVAMAAARALDENAKARERER